MKTLNSIVDALWQTPPAPSWGMEVEYHPDRFNEMYVTEKLFEILILDGMWDGSGPREAKTPPMHLFDWRQFVITVKMLSWLDIGFDESNEYSYGRHIHVRPYEYYDDNVSIFDRKMDYAVLLFAPFMGIVSDVKGDYVVTKFRRELWHWSGLRQWIDDHYRFVSWSRHHTVEIRLNERSPIEAYVATLAIYATWKTIPTLPFNVFTNRESRNVVLYDNGEKVVVWENNIVKVNIRYFRKYVTNAMNYLSDFAPKKAVKLIADVTKNVLKGNYVYWLNDDIKRYYPYVFA